MRKTPYMVSLVGLLISISLTLISISLPYWLYATGPVDEPTVRYIDYGLSKRCERRWVLTAPDGEVSREYICTPFPPRSICSASSSPFSPSTLLSSLSPFSSSLPPHSLLSSNPNSTSTHQLFCISYTSASYLSQLSLVFALGGLVTLILVNVTTVKRRRRTAWKIVVGWIFGHAVLQISTMSIVAWLVRYKSEEFAVGTTYSVSFWINIVSWVLDTVLMTGLVITGVAAEKGHRWAAGRRSYISIPDMPPASSQHTRQRTRSLRRGGRSRTISGSGDGTLRSGTSRTSGQGDSLVAETA